MQLTLLVCAPEGSQCPPLNDEHYKVIVADPAGPADVHAAVNLHNPVAIIVVGGSNAARFLGGMPFEFRKISYFAKTAASIDWNVRFPSWSAQTHGHPLDDDWPLLSIITTTYKSGHKILRPLESLRAQSYSNWEWILWDDSDDGHTETWDFLVEQQKTDSRIKLMRSAQHSGFIGHMKRLACFSARGKIVVEVDHDDLLHPDLLQWIVDADKKYPDANFFVSDDIELMEDNEAPFTYGDIAGLGYGSNMRRWIRDKWHYTRPVIPPNPVTLSYIVGVPNHVRAWKRDFYLRIDGHNARLPVADDYDLILRTFIASEPQWVHIVEPGYYQFRNHGGNNFTFKRNALIQHLVQLTWRRHCDAVLKACAERGMRLEDVPHVMPIWHSSHPGYAPSMRIFSPSYDPKKTVSVIIATYDRPAQLRRAIASVINQTYKDWLIYVIGDNCPSLENTMQELAGELPKDVLVNRLRWHNLETPSRDFGATPRNYAMRMHVWTDWVSFLDDDNQYLPDHLANAMTLADGADYIASGLLIEGKELKVRAPVKGRLDSSNVVHRRSLYGKHGYFRRDAGYAADWDLFSRWKDERFAATGKATVIYDTSNGNQSYASIAAMQDDGN